MVGKVTLRAEVLAADVAGVGSAAPMARHVLPQLGGIDEGEGAGGAFKAAILLVLNLM